MIANHRLKMSLCVYGMQIMAKGLNFTYIM